MFPVMSFCTRAKAVDPRRSLRKNSTSLVSTGATLAQNSMSVPNRVTRDSAASRNSVVEILPPVTGTSLKERFAVEKKV